MKLVRKKEKRDLWDKMFCVSSDLDMAQLWPFLFIPSPTYNLQFTINFNFNCILMNFILSLLDHIPWNEMTEDSAV